MTAKSPVLISWIAFRNDPFESRTDDNGEPVPGPTLTLLFDEKSPFKKKIGEVVILFREVTNEQQVVEKTKAEIQSRQKDMRISTEVWKGDDPTDHKAIFQFLKKKLPELRLKYKEQELIIHISPGTPSMQTIWVLMAETGFIEPPFQIVKSYRERERGNRAAVVPVRLGIETFYKAYQSIRPKQVASEEEAVSWDPGKFVSPVLKKVYTETRRFAHLNIPVLIMGERGTGKTTLAAWMRVHSPYKKAELDKKWPAIACGQYTPEMMRAELFGHVKGAFTDAKKKKDGLLKTVDGDTLFLDEVGDVSRDLQRLLIKALEEKSYTPLGSDKSESSDFRLITATNLPWKILQERLDPDFLDRISLLKLELPPLREMPDDIFWLWEAVYLEAARRAGVSEHEAELDKIYHRRIADFLKKHPLPGNLRNLFQVAYHLLAAISDPLEPMAPEEAVEYAISCLKHDTEVSDEKQMAQRVAKNFAESQPLDQVLQSHNYLNTKDIISEFKVYLAKELRRIAKDRSVLLNICDITDRTLRNWENKGKY
jgi:DNA-binding NtrC family response regulator